MASICLDNGLGPISCSRDFDFTLTFEQSIFSILPACLFLLLAPIRLVQLWRKPAVTPRNGLRLFKLIFASLNIMFHAALFILWSLPHVRPTQTSVPSATVSMVTALVLLELSNVEEKQSVRPSTLLNTYLILSIVFDAAQARTLWLTGRTDVAGVMTGVVANKIGMLLLEEHSKRSYLNLPYRQLPPGAVAGVFSNTFLWWLNGLFRRGFRTLLNNDDLFAVDPELSAGVLGENLQRQWETRKLLEGRWTLPKAVFWNVSWDLGAAAVPRAALIGFSFAQPFLITAAINHVEKDPGVRNENEGYGLIVATFLIYLGITVSTVHYKRFFIRVITKFRGAMIALLYTRSMTLPAGLCTESAAITLMSTDIDNIIELLENILDIWARVIEISIGTWLLERQIGAMCIVPLIMTLVCTVGQGAIASSIGQDQQNWNAAIQDRVRDTSSMLGSIKAIKMSGLANTVASNIQSQRKQELQISRPFLKAIIWLNGLADVPTIWSPTVSFIVFSIVDKIKGTNNLTAAKAFTALSIITLVTEPASKLLAAMPQVAAALGCFQRLQDYMLSESFEDTRRSETQAGEQPLPGSAERREQPSPLPGNAIEFKNATLLPAPKVESAVLSDVAVTIKSESVTFVLGPIGSGKTTLLKAILGELPCASGSIHVSSKNMSFCSQTPWLLNTTVKKNICGMGDEAVDVEWYEKVVYSCALNQDMQQWPEGDRSIIGSKGFMLSGGQKQRVALARALYSRRGVALLDDIFSALDARTQKLISHRLFSRDGLFRRLKTTLVLSMHTARFLHLADQVIVLGTDGKVKIQGSPEIILRKRELLHSLAMSDDGNEKGHDAVFYASDPKSSSDGDQYKKPDDLMDMTRSTSDLAVYAYYVKAMPWLLWIFFLLIQIIAAFGTNFPQVWLHLWITSTRPLSVNLAIYGILASIASVFTMLRLWITFLNIMPMAAICLHKVILDVVMRAPLSFFASTDLGTTLNRFSQDMSLVDLPLPGSLVSVTAALLNFIARLGLIATGSSYMAITIPFTLATIAALQHVYLRTSRQLRYLDLENKSPLYSHFLETLDGLPTIRALGWQVSAIRIQHICLDLSQRPYYLLHCIQQWLNLVLDLIVLALAVIVMTMAMKLGGTTSGGLLGVALNNILSFNQALSVLVTSWTSLETSLGAIARIKTFGENTPNENSPDATVEIPEEWPQKGEVRLSNISITYENGTSALKDISLAVSPGQKLGICGRTGSGKSSLILSLLRLVDLNEGNIVIDGVDISTISRQEIRERLIAIPQDLFTLPGSIRSNADTLGTASDEEIISALKKLGIWEILERRGGLDSVLPGNTLSQGEQQLFGLARALLRKDQSRVLILDEATSSVDSETDSVMQNVIKEEFCHHTIISVAHRLDTIRDSDLIVVLDCGKLVEIDSPDNLLARDSSFRRLYGS